MELVCPRCQAELDPAVGVCPKCGAPSKITPSGNEPVWRQQIRETVERRKKMRDKQLAKRDEEGKQLSIFPESSEPNAEGEDDPIRKRNAEIRARVEKKLSKPRPRVSRFSDAGDVTIPLGPAFGAAATAPELDTPLTELDEAEPLAESSGELDERVEVGRSEALSFELAAPGERVLSGLIDTRHRLAHARYLAISHQPSRWPVSETTCGFIGGGSGSYKRFADLWIFPLLLGTFGANFGQASDRVAGDRA